MFRWYKEEPYENLYQFCNPERRWVKRTPILYIDTRVATIVDVSSINDEVHRILRALPRRVDRIEVVPHQWVWDLNFVSVGIYLNTSMGKFHQVYSLEPQKKGWAHCGNTVREKIVAYCQALNFPASISTGRAILTSFEGYTSFKA